MTRNDAIKKTATRRASRVGSPPGSSARAGAGAPLFSLTWDYLERYLPLQAGRSRHTIESYRDGLSAFRRWLYEERGLGLAQATFGDCTRDLVLDFVEHMRAKGYAAGTINQRLAALRGYLHYAAGSDVAVQSVSLGVDGVPRAKGPQRVKEVLTEEQLEALISAPDPTTARGARDRAILAMLYDTAVRLSELVGLDVGDVWLDDGNPRVLVRGKGDRERFVAVGESCADHLRALLRRSPGGGADRSAPLFTTRHHGEVHRIADSTVQGIVQRCADVARESCPTMPERVYPHMLRRTRATDMYRAGTPIELVSAALGHKRLDTTMVYAIPSLDMLRGEMEASSKLAAPDEEPEWVGSEDELAALYGLR